MRMHPLLIGVACLCGTASLHAQTAKAPHTVSFVVVVTSATGQPVNDLSREDFAVYDRNSVTPIKEFRALSKDGSTGDTPYPNYEITFEAAPAMRDGEFHRVGIRVDRPNLQVRTRQGYIARSE